MCKGDSPEVDTSFQDWSMNEAAKARREEKLRQHRVDEGMDRIGAIFDGGRYRPLTAARGGYDPDAKYFLNNGKRWRPQEAADSTQSTPYKTTSQGRYYRGGDGNVYFESTVDDGAWYDLGAEGDWESWSRMQAAPELATLGAGPTAREQYRGMKDKLKERGKGRKYAGMEPLLDAREKAMRGYYMPALRENYGDAKDELTFALARAGLGVSTAANEKRSKLQQGFRKERAGVQADIARDRAATASGINDQRSAIEAALRSSGDASAAADAALRSRSTFAQDQPEMSPLANTLLGFAQGIGQSVNGYQTGQVRRTAAGGFQDQSRIVS